MKIIKVNGNNSQFYNNFILITVAFSIRLMCNSGSKGRCLYIPSVLLVLLGASIEVNECATTSSWGGGGGGGGRM